MNKKVLFVLTVSLLSPFIFNEGLIGKTREMNYKKNLTTDFSRKQNKKLGGPMKDGSGPFKDGRGLNPNCPLKEVNQDADEGIQKKRNNSGRVLKHDGSGPNKDGQGPRGSNLGPKENCPKK